MTVARPLRNFSIGLLIFIGSLAFGAYIVVHWAERQILTPDNWVALVAPLPKQQVVSDALGSHISNQLFATVPVQQRVTEALPERAAFLAPALTSQLQELTTRAARKLVASDGFQTVWTGANRLAINRLVTTARGETPPLQAAVNERFNINLAGSASQLRSALGAASEAIPALQPAANQAVTVSADLQARPKRLQQAVRSTDFLASVLPLLIIACLLGAVALSRQRRRTTMVIASSIAVVILLELIALKWLRQEVLDQVRQAGNLAAVAYIFDTLVSWLRSMLITTLWTAVAVAGFCAIAGTTRARSALAYIHLDQLRHTKAASVWQSFRQWVANNQHYLWLTAVAAVLAVLALVVPISTETIVNAVLVTLSLLALVHIVATPRRQSSGQTRSDKNPKVVTGVTAA